MTDQIPNPTPISAQRRVIDAEFIPLNIKRSPLHEARELFRLSKHYGEKAGEDKLRLLRSELAISLRRRMRRHKAFLLAQQNRQVTAEALKESARLRAELRRVIDEMEKHAAEFSLDLVERILGEQGNLLRPRLIQELQKFFTLRRHDVRAEVFVHADDIAEVQNILGPSGLALRTTTSLQPGEAHVVTSSGSVIISWREQLNQLREALQQ